MYRVADNYYSYRITHKSQSYLDDEASDIHKIRKKLTVEKKGQVVNRKE